MEQHTTLKAEHEALMSAHRRMAIELREATKQRNTWKEECDRQTEMVKAKQDNLEQCTMLLTGWQKSPLRSFCSPSARRARASRSEAKHACAGELVRLRAAAIVRAWSAATLLLATHRMLMLMRSMEDTQAEPGMVQRCPGSCLDPCAMLEAALSHELRLGPRGAPRRGWMPIEEGPRRCTLCVACRSTRTFAH